MIDIESLRSYIEGKGFISSVKHLDEIDSTNTYAKKKEIQIDSLVIAEHQSAGKGRLGRKWISEKHSNLTFSIKKKLPLSPAENHFAVFYFSYYLYSAIKKWLTDKLNVNELEALQIKWPNDILFGRKKLSGILIESVLPGGIYIIGIGVNCNQTDFHEEIDGISIKEITGSSIDLSDLLTNILNEFSLYFHELENNNFDKIFNNWKNSTKMIGKDCEFQTNSNTIKLGKISDLNKDGSISIENKGEITKYFSGDIKLAGLG